MPRSGIAVGCALPSGEAREADRSRSPVGAEDLLVGRLADLHSEGILDRGLGAVEISPKRPRLERQDGRAPEPFNFLNIDVYAQDHLSAGAVIGNTSSFRASGEVLLVQHFFHFVHELRRKEGFFQNVCSVLDQFTQFGKFVSKASDKQELHLGASQPNLLRHLKAVELGHDDIAHRKVYCTIVLLA